MYYFSFFVPKFDGDICTINSVFIFIISVVFTSKHVAVLYGTIHQWFILDSGHFDNSLVVLWIPP